VRVIAPASLILGVLLSACSPSRDATDDGLVVWHAYRGAELKALTGSVERCAEALETSARVVAIPYDAFVNKVSVAVPRGNGPDIFIAAHDRLGHWAAGGLLEPLGFWSDEALADRFFEQTLESLVFRGTSTGCPSPSRRSRSTTTPP